MNIQTPYLDNLEGDKDYIARVALSADMDLVKHKQVFKAFVKNM